MGELERSKAERAYFQPDKVVALGFPEKCANCPRLNNILPLMAISAALDGGGFSGWSATDRHLELINLKTASESCTGCETLDDDELSQYADSDGGEVEVSIGYRCGVTREITVATDYESGVTGSMTMPYKPDEIPPAPAELETGFLALNPGSDLIIRSLR